MPSKKKKYNARFPPARIKKIMQTDEDVGKVAAAVPVIISRALELFIDSLIEKTASVTRAKNAKTLSASHIKQAIQSEKTFDFLQDLVKNVPDHQTEEEMDTTTVPSGSGTVEKKQKVPRPRKPREEGARGPGRPRKVKVEEKKESASEPEPSDEETETDEEGAGEVENHPASQYSQGQASGPILSPVGQFGAPLTQIPTSAMSGPSIGDTSSQPAVQPSDTPVMSSTIPTPQFTSISHILSPSQQGTSVDPNVSNMQGDQQPLFSAQYPNPPQGQPLMSPGHQQQQGVPGAPVGFPMHNMGFPPYPYMGRGLPVPYVHPQACLDHQLPTTNMHAAYTQSGMQQYPPHPRFLPPRPPYMMPQMETRDPRFMAPSVVPGMPMGPPPPLFSMKHNQPSDSGDASMPLDMSLAGKSRLPSTSAESTSSLDRPPVTDSANSELSRLPHPPVPQPTPHLPQWNVNNTNNQNMLDLTVSKSQTMEPLPLVKSSESQSNNPVTENGRHIQNSASVGKKTTESKSRDASVDKTVSFPGLANIMNMRAVKTSSVSEETDDDYDS